MDEIWKDVEGYLGAYQVSNLSRVRSLRYKGRMLKQYICRGYWRVSLSVDTIQHDFFVHRLVAKAFIPNPEHKPYINHKDGDKSNSAVTNLEWCTQSENVKHSFTIGTQSNKGESHPSAKITLAQSVEIKKLIGTGQFYQREIARKFNISEHLVSKIKKGKLWNY